MKILITGGTGFIGRNLLAGLALTNDVLAPGRDALDLLCEESVKRYFEDQFFDVVIHCATWDATWNSEKDPSLILDHNLRMFFNLVHQRSHVARFICLGSGAEFSRSHWIPRMREEYFGVHIPADAYGFSKYLINQYIIHTTAFNVINLRLFGLFGPYEDWRTRFISNSICRALYDLPITIIQDVAFDYLFIDDFCQILNFLLRRKPREKVYNVCRGEVFLLSDLAKMVLELLNKDLPIEIIKTGYGLEYSGDNSRLLSEFPGIMFSSIRPSIQILINWYQSHIEEIPFHYVFENGRVHAHKRFDGGVKGEAGG